MDQAEISMTGLTSITLRRVRSSTSEDAFDCCVASKGPLRSSTTTRFTRCLLVLGCFLELLDSEWRGPPCLGAFEADPRFEVGTSSENKASSALSFSRREISLSTWVETLARDSSWRLLFGFERVLLDVKSRVLRLMSPLRSVCIWLSSPSDTLKEASDSSVSCSFVFLSATRLSWVLRSPFSCRNASFSAFSSRVSRYATPSWDMADSRSWFRRFTAAS